jgi:hypothetical protein
MALPLKFSSNDNSALMYMAKQGTTICYLPDYNADKLIEQGDIHEVLAEFPKKCLTFMLSIYPIATSQR